MTQFIYKVRELSGKEVVGEMEGKDRYSVAAELRSTGKTVVSVEEKGGRFNFDMEAINAMLSKVKQEELIVFSHNLSAMMKAGLSMSRGLMIQERQTKNPALKKTLKTLSEEVNKGSTLSAGMAKFPKVFSPIFVSMVRAGEESGGLSDALLIIGDQMEKSYLLKKKIKGALIYPVVVISTLFIIAVLMFIYVVPTLAATFKELNTELPTSTKVIMWISDFLSTNLLMGVIGLAVIIATFIFTIRTQVGARGLEFVSFRLPIVGELVRQSNSALMARTLSSLLSSGVEMLEAINITKDVLQNSYFKEQMNIVAERVQKGAPLSSVFLGNPIFPLLVGDMIEVGEETGKLADMLHNLALFYENEVDEATKNMSTIIEPLLMVFIGGSVGFFAISMISPMYSVMSNV
ncbi:MAG: type II secretion system F family protein [Candidatus Pacebacteria bacterium]|jgi:type IV pilus assembly protein PilC|nr:type II secretion system F family protein [Candidatus Paceibacterota bacterium]